MFKSKKYILQTKDKLFEICILLFIPRNKYILDISYEKGNSILVQCVSDNKLSYVSYVTDNSDETLYVANVLFNFMQNNNLLIPVTLEKIVEYTINKEEEFVLTTPIQFKTNKHVFIATIKEIFNGYSVKIGGIVYSACMDIFIYDHSSQISQIFSEPECDTKFREDTFNAIDTVEMIKASLQVCQLLFDVNKFEFLDMSNIECDKTGYKTRKPPRSFFKPFSLTHLYLVTHCKTWYEYYFNARLNNITNQINYEKNKQFLIKPIGITLSKLAEEYKINDDVKTNLSKYYDASKSIVEIVTSMPIAKRCELLRWVPTYIDYKIGILLRSNKWIIELDTISKNNNNIKTNKITQINMYKYNATKFLEPKKEEISIVTKCEKALSDKPKPMTNTNMFIIIKNNNLAGGNRRRNKTTYNKFKKKYNKTRKSYYDFKFSNEHYDYRNMYN